MSRSAATLPPKPLPITSTSTSRTDTRRSYDALRPAIRWTARCVVSLRLLALAPRRTGVRRDDPGHGARRPARRHPRARPIVAGAGNDPSRPRSAASTASTAAPGRDIVSADPSIASPRTARSSRAGSPSTRRRIPPASTRPPSSRTASPGARPSSPPTRSAAVRERGASNIGVAFSTDAGRDLAARCFRRDGRVPAARAEARRVRPDRRLRRRARRLARRHAHDRAPRRTSTSSRSTDGLHGRCPVAAASGPRSTRTGLRATTARRAHSRPLLRRVHATTWRRHETASGATTAASTWSVPVQAGSRSSSARSRSMLPTERSSSSPATYDGEEALSGSIVALRSTDGGATFTRVSSRASRRPERRDARDLAAVGRRRRERDDLRRLERLPLPSGLHGERHRPVDLHRRV